MGDWQGCLWALGVNSTNKYLKFFVKKPNFIENFVFGVDLLVKEGRNGKLRGQPICMGRGVGSVV